MTEKTPKKSRGRPRKSPTIAVDPDALVVAVESPESVRFRYEQVGSSSAKPSCVLSIPNLLLYQWQSEPKERKTNCIETVSHAR